MKNIVCQNPSNHTSNISGQSPLRISTGGSVKMIINDTSNEIEMYSNLTLGAPSSEPNAELYWDGDEMMMEADNFTVSASRKNFFEIFCVPETTLVVPEACF